MPKVVGTRDHKASGAGQGPGACSACVRRMVPGVQMSRKGYRRSTCVLSAPATECELS